MQKRLGDRRTDPASRKPLDIAVSPFVGRGEELRRLTAALTLATEGQGGTVFITGHQGIGKTRFAGEVLTLARRRGFTVLEGRAYQLGAGLAYAPFVDSLRSLLRGLDSTPLAGLISDLPSLGRLFEGLGLPPPEPLGDPALEKTRLFESMLRLIERLSEEAPVILFIDDVHWADPASLELLHYLARGLSVQPALLLATCSAGALHTFRGLRALAAPLQQDGLAEEIVIPRLAPKAVGELVRGVLGGEAPADLLDLLEARAGGTPLFVEALLSALIDSGSLVRSPSGKDGWLLDSNGVASLPPSVRQLIVERLERLEAADRRALNLLAVMGDATTYAVLRAVSGMGERALLDALRHLQSMGLVSKGIDGPDVAYSIAHPLVQESAYSELPEVVRRRIHAKAIEVLEFYSEGHPDDPWTLPSASSGQALSHLARHYRGAGPAADPNRALSVLVAAGERARSLYANEEAAQHYFAALAMVREGVEGGRWKRSLPSSLTTRLPWLLDRLGEAWERSGEDGKAVEAWNEALALLSEGLAEGEREENVAVAGLHSRLAMAEWDRGHFDVARAHVEAGLDILQRGVGLEPCQELADLHFARFYILARLGDVAGVANSTAELISVAGKLKSPRAEAEALLVASVSCLWQSDVTNARQLALHALAVAERAQDLVICYRVHGVLLLTSMRLGDPRLMHHDTEQGLVVARRLSAPNVEVSFRVYSTHASFLSGDWEKSLRYSVETVSLARRVGYARDLAFSLAERAIILTLRGDLRDAEDCISEARLAFGSGTPADIAIFGLIDVAETALALELGQPERALAVSKDFICRSASATTPAGLAPQLQPIGLALFAEAQVATGDAEGALETACRIKGLGPADTPYFIALTSRVEGLARQSLGQWEDAVTCLRRAHEAFTAVSIPFEAARCLLEQASAMAVEQPESVTTVAQQSLAVFERLGARRYAKRTHRLLRGLGISAPSARRTRLGTGVMSTRQLEVACLVAEGLTMVEIANRLSLSGRTVEHHLENIYLRLGIGSRVDLIRYMIESGLLLPRGKT